MPPQRDRNYAHITAGLCGMCKCTRIAACKVHLRVCTRGCMYVDRVHEAARMRQLHSPIARTNAVAFRNEQ